MTTNDKAKKKISVYSQNPRSPLKRDENVELAWIKSFASELEYERQILQIVENQIDNLLQVAKKDAVLDDGFIEYAQEELKKTLYLENRMARLIQAMNEVISTTY